VAASEGVSLQHPLKMVLQRGDVPRAVTLHDLCRARIVNSIGLHTVFERPNFSTLGLERAEWDPARENRARVTLSSYR
jgi:hypothetical protein